eukprot:767436-Hanusia_phi.AAC.16
MEKGSEEETGRRRGHNREPGRQKGNMSQTHNKYAGMSQQWNLVVRGHSDGASTAEEGKEVGGGSGEKKRLVMVE